MITSLDPIDFPGGFPLSDTSPPATPPPDPGPEPDPDNSSHPLDELQAGHWYEVPSSRLDSADPCPSVYCPPGNSGLRGVIGAWSGGALDTNRERLLVWGGGHADYAGNEIYAFDIDSLEWSRATDPSVASGGSMWLYGDGTPRSLHTHTYIEYVPTVDKFISFGGVAPYPLGGVTRQVFAFDFASNRWQTDVIPDVPSGGEARGSNAVFDPTTGDVWVTTANSGSSRLNRYNPTTNSWTTYSTFGSLMYTTAALDVKRNLLVAVGNNRLYVWNLNTPSVPPVRQTSTGDRALEGAQAPGFSYDPTIEKFVGWNGGDSVYVLDPDNWSWSRQSAASGNSVTPTSAHPNGTYGRFQYLPDRNAYVVVNSVSENVYLYRLNDATLLRPSAPPNTR